MNVTRLEYLFRLCVKNEATDKQRQEMLKLLTLPENESIAKKMLHDAFEVHDQTYDISPDTRESILKAIYNTGKEKDRDQVVSLNKKSINWLAVAAALFIFISVATYFLSIKTKPVRLIAKSDKNKILPGGNKAILILADGSKINLNDAKNGEIAKQAGLSIKKTKYGQLVYTAAKQKSSSNSSANKLVYNTIVTPVGGQYQVDLPDGTKVWLNAGSSLKYPTTFASNERRVELTGEGYFEVAKNKAKPFKVVTDKQEVEVLGTHFNVNAYANENAVRTTLLEGSVRVLASHTLNQLTVLKPGEQSTLNSKGLMVQDVDTEDAIDWKNGYFNFDEDLGSIMRKLARWYNIEIVYAADVDPNMSFGGKISRSKNINSVLNIIDATGNVHFKIEGRRVTVMK